MPLYTFRLPAAFSSTPVTVYNTADAQQATGTTDANAVFTATLPTGDYYAKVSYGYRSYRAAGEVDRGDLDNISEAGLLATYAPLTARIADLAEPWVIAHRGGGSQVYPEHTMETYRAVVAAGAQAIECDCWLLADGALGVMHDSTIDRTTTGTGNVQDQSSASWANLTVDSAPASGSAWNNAKPPYFAQVLNEFGGKVVIAAEAKNSGAEVALAREVIKRRLFDSVQLSSADWTQVTTMRAMDSRLNIAYGGSDKTPAQLQAAGIQWVVLNKTRADGAAVSDAAIAPYVAAGIKVNLYALNRRVDRDKYVAMGVNAFYSDNPIYFQGNTALRTSDPFKAGTVYHGQIDNFEAVRGTYGDPGWLTLGTTGNIYVLQGWGSPIANRAGTYTITFQMKFPNIGSDTNQYAQVAFCCPTDEKFVNTSAQTVDNGYTFRIRASGLMSYFKHINGALSGGNGVDSGSTAARPFTNGEVGNFRITVSPTQVKMERLDAGATAIITVNDTTHRGGYFHLAKQDGDVSGLTAAYRSVVIA